jgi:23S rRNA G2445 N2-methylase RlmL
MKTQKLPRLLNRVLDEVYTPTEAVDLLIPFLDKKKIIWECADGHGHISNYLRRIGFSVVGGNNFFNEKPEADLIVSNPPYSLKDKFLERAYNLHLPFAFLLPLTALGGIKRTSFYNKFGLQLIIPNKRINFMTGTGKKSCWFHTAWFTNGLRLSKDICFRNL